MNPYINCPIVKTKSFILRLVEKEDSNDLFECYNDKKAVSLMNDDNCDFGFFSESEKKMAETVDYWIDFYKKQCFIRFSIVDLSTSKVIGTVEGFNGDTGVLRIDICSNYETEEFLSQLLTFAKDNFFEYFGNDKLLLKAIPEAKERIAALQKNNWDFIGTYKTYTDYYQTYTTK